MDKNANRIITFTSDFGSADGYVGIVKGVMLSINPQAKIVDLSHHVEHFNVSSAGWIIYNAFNYFPKETIHMVIVDPGVGSSQRRIVLSQDDVAFVGPDNGLFSLVILDPLSKRNNDDSLKAFQLKTESSDRVSSTFHARDLFGPVAAKLSRGERPEKLGTPIEISSLSLISDIGIRCDTSSIRGRVIHVDTFGNLITSIPALGLPEDCVCLIENTEVVGLKATYRSVSKNQIAALRGSHGFLEIAVCEGRADQATDATIGSPVEVRLSDR